MYCVKCGRETVNEQVFCQDCQQEMGKYPVQPGTVVLLPRRKDSAIIKKNVKRSTISAEEQIKILNKRVMILSLLLLVSIAAICLMLKPTLHYVLDEHVEIGQNYSTVTVTSSAPTSGD